MSDICAISDVSAARSPPLPPPAIAVFTDRYSVSRAASSVNSHTTVLLEPRRKKIAGAGPSRVASSPRKMPSICSLPTGALVNGMPPIDSDGAWDSISKDAS